MNQQINKNISEPVAKRLYQVMVIMFDVVYSHDFFGNKQFDRLQKIQKEYKRFKNKSFTYDQYLHLFIDHIKDEVIRDFSSLNQIDVKINFYNNSDVFHNFIKKTLDILFNILKNDKQFLVETKEFREYLNSGINYDSLVIFEIHNKLNSKLEFVGLLNGEGLK